MLKISYMSKAEMRVIGSPVGGGDMLIARVVVYRCTRRCASVQVKWPVVNAVVGSTILTKFSKYLDN